MATPDFEYTIERKRAGLTSIRISVSAKGIVVRAPFYVPEFAVHQYVKSQGEWIRKQMAKYGGAVSKEPTYENGSTMLYLGLEFPLSVDEHTHGVIPRVRFHNKRFEAQIPPILTGALRTKKLKQLFKEWYRREAERVIRIKVKEYASLLGVEYGRITLKEVSSIWGSCSPDNNLSFNIALIRSPMPVLEYVVAHEISHIIHKNHGKAFWNTVMRMCPHYKKYVSWLRRHGHAVAE